MRGFPLGERSRLVERQRGQRAEIFERATAFDQHAAARRTRNARQDGARRRDGQRARACRDEDRHGAIEAVAEWLVDNDPGEEQDEHEREHARHEDALELVGEALGRRFLRLRFAHHLHDLGERRIGGKTGYRDLDRAIAVDGAREDTIFPVECVGLCRSLRAIGHRFLVNGDALAGNRGLVDRRAANDDEAVGSKSLIGLDDDGVANRQLLDGDFARRPVGILHRRGLRRQLGERLDRALGAAHGIMFERMAEAEEEEEQCALGPCTERCGAGRGDEHQRVDLEALELQILDGFADRKPAAEAISGNIECERHPLRCRGEHFDGKADAEDETAQQREDQFGPLAENAAMIMAMVVVVLTRVAMFVIRPMRMIRSMVMAIIAMLVGGLCRASRSDGSRFLCDAHIRECLSDRFDGGFRALELGAQRPRGADFGLDHARHFAKLESDRPRAPGVAGAFEVVPEEMLILAGELGAGAARELPHAFERENIRTVMDAELRRRAVAGADHMHLVDAVASFEFAHQARDAAVGGIGDFGEEKRNIEPQLVTHDAILFSWQPAMRSAPMFNARQDEVREYREVISRTSLTAGDPCPWWGANERGLRRPGFKFKFMRDARSAARSGTGRSCGGNAFRAQRSSGAGTPSRRDVEMGSRATRRSPGSRAGASPRHPDRAFRVGSFPR